MKTSIARLALTAAALAAVLTFIAAPQPLQAQQTTTDSAVTIVADAQGLPAVVSDQWPAFGTFWSVRSSLPCLSAPWPCPPLDPSVPVYLIGGNQYLVDETGGQIITPEAQGARRLPAGATPASILQAQVDELQAFIGQVQSWQLNQQSGLNARTTPGDGGDGVNNWGGPPFAPLLGGPGSCDDYGKRFWFSSITLTSGAIHLTLTNTVAGFNYSIWRTTTLGNPSAWTQVQSLPATGSVAVASPITLGAAQSGFFRATLDSDPLGLGWVTNLLDVPISSSAATAGDCTVFISAAGYLYALDFASGAIKWTAPLDNGDPLDLQPSPAVAADGSAVFVASHGGTVLALTPDAVPLWSNYLGNAIGSSPAISAADGTVYVATDSGSPGLFALNPATGATNWVFQPNTPFAVGTFSDASIAVGPDCTVYFVATSGDLYALHPDGSLAWFFPFRAGFEPQSSPAIDSTGQILVGSADGYVYCLSPSGGLKWLFNTGDSNSPVSSLAIGADSTVYAATFAGNLFAITNGGLRWKYTAPATNQAGLPPSFISSPAVNSNNVVFIGSYDPSGETDGLFVVSNGLLQAFYPTADRILGSPVIARDSVIIADRGGKVHKFPGAGYPAAAAPWPQFRLNSFHTGATPNPACVSTPSAPFPNNPYMAPGRTSFGFYLSGAPGSVWAIYASTNLVDWEWAGGAAIDQASGYGSFDDSATAGVARRFYQARSGGICSRIVGFVNQTLQPGTNLIANQLFQVNDGYYPQNTAKGWTDLLIGTGVETPPDQTELRKWNGASFDSAAWDKGRRSWFPNGDLTLLAGQALFLINTSNQPVTIPFMGLVAPGVPSNSVALGPNFLSSMLPKPGLIHTDLGFNPDDGDSVLLWRTNHYTTNTYSAAAGWSAGEPSLGVGEGFLLLSTQTTNWTQTPVPCPPCDYAVVVTNNPLWTDTGLTVATGDVVRVAASGVWNGGVGPDLGPNGDGSGSTSVGFLGPASWASLIAFVGPDPYRDDQGVNHWQTGDGYFPRPAGTNYWFVGADGQFTATRTGKLWLGFNDDAVTNTTTADNTGHVNACVQITTP